jgi:hypothetical protein
VDRVEYCAQTKQPATGRTFCSVRQIVCADLTTAELRADRRICPTIRSEDGRDNPARVNDARMCHVLTQFIGNPRPELAEKAAQCLIRPLVDIQSITPKIAHTPGCLCVEG